MTKLRRSAPASRADPSIAPLPALRPALRGCRGIRCQCISDTQEASCPLTTLNPSVVLDRVSFAWPDGTSALADRLRRVRRRSHRARRPQRLRQVDAAAPDRRRADPRRRAHHDVDGCRVPPAAAHPRRRPARRRAARRGRDARRAARDRVGRRRPAPLRRRRLRLGHRGARARRARRGRAVAGHARPPRRRAVRRRGGARRDRRHPAARGGHRAARRADEQPRPRRAGAALRRWSAAGAAPWSW